MVRLNIYSWLVPASRRMISLIFSNCGKNERVILSQRGHAGKHVVGKPVMYNQMNPMSSLSLFAPRQVAVQQPLPQSSRRWVSLSRRRKWPDCPVQNATCEQAFIHSDTWAPASHLVTQLCVCVTNPYLTSYYCKCGPSH